jgi:Lon protease-like protein
MDEEGRPWEEIAASIAARSDPTALAHAVAGLVRVETGQRQRLLEAPTTVARLELLEALLVRESALLARHLLPFAADPRSLPLRRN